MEGEKLKKGFITLFVLAFIFSFNLSVLADEGHDDDVKQAAKNFRDGTNVDEQENREETNIHQDNVDGHSEGEDSHHESEDVHGAGTATPEHSDTAGHDEGNDETNHSSGNTEDTEGEHEEGADEGHHGPVVETPPNYKVLGTYGALNFSFILIGVWNKWFRRKGK